MNRLKALGVVLFAIVASGIAADAHAKHLEESIEVDGCKLLANPAHYNHRIVRVDGLVYSDFEHFDLRLTCDGYLQLAVSTDSRSEAKYGFKTIDDSQLKELMSRIKLDEMFSTGKKARATVTGLFRCHYDFPDCKDLSLYGDSSIVILSVSNVRSSEQLRK